MNPSELIEALRDADDEQRQEIKQLLSSQTRKTTRRGLMTAGAGVLSWLAVGQAAGQTNLPRSACEWAGNTDANGYDLLNLNALEGTGITGGERLTNIAGTNLTIDADGNLNASGGSSAGALTDSGTDTDGGDDYVLPNAADNIDLQGDGAIQNADTISGTSATLQSLSAGEGNTNARFVPQFGTLQGAHDDLPASGGVIYVTEGIAETGVSLDKPVKVTNYGVGRRDGTAREIDTSGGDGIHVTADDVVLEDLSITGDGTSYCVKIGESGTLTSDTVLRNVGIVGGLDSLVYEGQGSNHDWRTSVKNSDRHNIVIDLTGDTDDFFNANELSVSTIGAADHGFLIDGTGGGGRKFQGNTLDNFWSAGHGGDGLRVDGALNFRGNRISGYGVENVSGTTLNATGLGSGSGNNQLFWSIGSGPSFDSDDWEDLRIATDSGYTGKWGQQIDDGLTALSAGSQSGRSISNASPGDAVNIVWTIQNTGGYVEVDKRMSVSGGGDLQVTFEEVDGSNACDVRWFAYKFSF